MVPSPAISSVPAGISSSDRARRRPVLADEQHAVLGIDRDDRDRARVAGDLARAARLPSARSTVSTRNVR